MTEKIIQQPDIDAAFIKKEKFYILLFFIGILIVALLAIGIMAYMAFYSHSLSGGVHKGFSFLS